MITQVLTPFDSTKQAIEGTTSFRANASYSWSWLIEHSNQQNTLISQINSTTTEMNSLAQTVTTKAQEVANNTTTVNQAKLDAQSARDITLNAKAAVEAIGGVGLTNLSNGDTLEYDSSTSKFKNTNTHSKTAKTTLADADEIMIADSASAWSLKKITWANIKATLALLFILKVNTPTTNALGKIDANGNIVNSNIINDANGNSGFGVIPSAWTVFKVIELGAGNGIYASNGLGQEIHISNNAYYNSGYKYALSYSASDYKQEAGGHYWRTAPSGTAGNPITWTNAMTLDTNGNLTVGGNSTMSVITAKYDASNYIYTQARNTADTTEIFLALTGGVKRSAILANGTYQSATNVYGSTSDIKLKENIVDTTPKLDKLMQVQVRNFNYIGQEDSKQIGVIAQEIEQIFPSVVFETKDTKQVEVEKERIIPAIDEAKDKEGNIVVEAKPESIEKYIEIETQETGEVTKNVKYSIIYMMMLKGMQEMRAEYTAEIQSLKDELAVLKGAK